MTVALGGNQLFGASVTVDPAPNASYTLKTMLYMDDALSDYATSQVLVGNHPLDPQEIGSYTGWNQSADDTVEITIDIGEARGGDVFTVQGYYGSSSIDRPKAVLLEYSDNASDWTTVLSESGLSAGATGTFGWIVQADISASGDHRYWRLTLTHNNTWIFVGDLVIE